MRYAVKRLTRSDLTLFEVQLRRQNAGKQKAINLNREVFVDVLFPGAPLRAGDAAMQFPCSLRILGPDGITDARNLMRKVIAAGGSQKNWRLNGETVRAEQDAPFPGRYNDLNEGDIAVFGFEGVDVPDAITMVLLRSASAEDGAPHAALSQYLGLKSMRAVGEADLQAAVDSAGLEHPLRELLDADLDEALEDAAQGSPTAAEKLRHRSPRRTSHKALAEARANAERIGRDGEVLVRGFLRGQVVADGITSFVWEAEENATHPFDFTVTQFDGRPVPVEVKSTSGPHARAVMFSHAEVIFAARTPAVEVWRLSEMQDGQAVLRKSAGLSVLASVLVEKADGIAAGVMPNGWTISPEALGPWSDPIAISVDDDPEE